MSTTQIDRAETSSALNTALRLVARSAVECALLSGSLRGPLGAALAEPLARAAQDSLRALGRLAEIVTLLDAQPSLQLAGVTIDDPTRETAIDQLVRSEEETLQALVDAIPADADDALGESVEHVVEHAVMERSELIARLRRARGGAS
jgi:bacterioferritin (cytochrome b1)